MVEETNKEAVVEKKGPVFRPFPHYMKIERTGKGLLRVKTNTHVVDNAPEDNLDFVCLPYAGIGCAIELHCEDEALRQAIYTRLEKNTDLHVFFKDEHPLTKSIYRNYIQMYNNKDNYKSLQSLSGLAKGKTILFCGAGPSLLDNLSNIKEVIRNNKAIVIAGGSALRVLAKHKVYPHFGLAFDPTEKEEKVVFDFLDDEFLENVNMIITPGLWHSCFKRVKHGYVGTTSALPDFTDYMEPGEQRLNEGRIGVSTMAPHIGTEAMYKDNKVQAYADLSKEEEDKVGAVQGQIETIEHNGYTTKLGWVREVRDVVQTVSKHSYKFRVMMEESLYDDEEFKVRHRTWQQLMSKKSKPLVFKDKEKGQSIGTVRGKLVDWLEDLLILLPVVCAKEVDLGEYNENNAYRRLLFMYDTMQRFRKVRTGDYNNTLLKYVVKNNIEEVRKALKNG